MCRFDSEPESGEEKSIRRSRPQTKNSNRPGIGKSMEPEINVWVEPGMAKAALSGTIPGFINVTLCTVAGEVLRVLPTNEPGMTVTIDGIATGNYVIAAEWEGGRYGETIHVP